MGYKREKELRSLLFWALAVIITIISSYYKGRTGICWPTGKPTVGHRCAARCVFITLASRTAHRYPGRALSGSYRLAPGHALLIRPDGYVGNGKQATILKIISLVLPWGSKMNTNVCRHRQRNYHPAQQAYFSLFSCLSAFTPPVQRL